MWMRTIKSAEEIALIREGARIADLGGAACVAAIAPGVGDILVVGESGAEDITGFPFGPAHNIIRR
jgi:Xaa-Pro aminopeptidase